MKVVNMFFEAAHNGSLMKQSSNKKRKKPKHQDVPTDSASTQALPTLQKEPSAVLKESEDGGVAWGWYGLGAAALIGGGLAISGSSGGSGGSGNEAVVTPINHVPVAVADNLTVDENTQNNIINVLANDSDADGDGIHVTQAQAKNGQVSIHSDGTLSYTPNHDFIGVDTVDYTISDGKGGQVNATLNVRVNDVIELVPRTGYVQQNLDYFLDFASATLVDEQGRLLVFGGGRSNGDPPVLGALTILRFLPDGTLDTSFGQNGVVRHQVNDTGAYARSVAWDGEGGILVAGAADEVAMLMRLNADGSLDAQFGDGGVVVKDFNLGQNTSIWGEEFGADRLTQIFVDQQGRIIVSGLSEDYASSQGTPVVERGIVQRYLPNGALDSSFGQNGTVYFDGTQFGSVDDIDFVLSADDKIVAAGDSYISFSNTTNGFLVQLNQEGAVDTSFAYSNDGVSLFATQDVISALTHIISDRQGGYYITGLEGLAHVNTQGAIDMSFGHNGVVSLSPNDVYESYANDLWMDSKGRVMLLNDVSDGENGSVTSLLRFNPDGSPDTAFSDDGRVDFSIANPEGALSITQGEGNSVLISGMTNLQLCVWRFLENGTLDSTFGQPIV